MRIGIIGAGNVGGTLAQGNLRFPLDRSIPYALISRIVKARVKENQERADERKKKKG